MCDVVCRQVGCPGCIKVEPDYECENCGGTEPEEVTGGWRCAACRYQPPECTCYEMTGGHQPGCAFNAANRR